MTKGVYERTEEHRHKVIEGIRKFYASPASQKTREEIGQKVSEYYRTHPKHNSPATRKRISIGLKKYYKTHDSPFKDKKIDRNIVEKGRQSRLQYYENNEVWNKNRKHSKTTRKRISQAMKRWWQEKKKEGR